MGAEMKTFFIFLFVLAFLPLTFACGPGHEGGTSASTTLNEVHEGNMMYDFYGIGFFTFLIPVLIIISLILFIFLMIKNLKGGKN